MQIVACDKTQIAAGLEVAGELFGTADAAYAVVGGLGGGDGFLMGVVLLKFIRQPRQRVGLGGLREDEAEGDEEG